MDRYFLVHRLVLDNNLLTVSLYPSKFPEVESLEEISIITNDIQLIMRGQYSTDKFKAGKYPLIYNPNDILEGIQVIENNLYYIEIETLYDTVDIITKVHNSSVTPFNKVPSFRDNIKKGVLNWKSYVGKTEINIYLSEDNVISLPVEVRAAKVNYLDDYKYMVDSISENLADIIWSESSPSNLKMSKLINSDEPSLLETFFFFREAMTQSYIPQFWQIITSNLTTQQTNFRKNVSLGEVNTVDSQSIVSIVSRPEYLVETTLSLGDLSYLNNKLPEIVDTPYRRLTFDTPENQFLLYWFEEMRSVLNEILLNYDSNTLVAIETKKMLSQINEMLDHTMFNDVSHLGHFDNNNLAIRRLQGYSGVFNIYEEYQKRGKVFWQEYFDLLYNFEVKAVYDIYELWVLFEIIDIIKDISTGNINYNFSRKGRDCRIRSITAEFQSLTVKVQYQKRCRVSNKYIALTTYSIPMIPDYLISIWDGNKFLGGIVFDAKYKYDHVKKDEELELLNGADESRVAKQTDIVKMHSYKDSIRGIYGSYVIFPGKDTEGKIYNEQFTALPSIGAFPLYPSSDNLSLKLSQKKAVQDFIKTALMELTL